MANYDIASMGSVGSKIDAHNTDASSHPDIRTGIATAKSDLETEIQNLRNQLASNRVFLGRVNFSVATTYNISGQFTWTGSSSPARAISFSTGTVVPKVGDCAVWYDDLAREALCRCIALPNVNDSTWQFLAFASTRPNPINKVSLDTFNINPSSSNEGSISIVAGDELPVTKDADKLTLYFSGSFSMRNSGGTNLNMYPVNGVIEFHEKQDVGYMYVTTGDYSPSSGDFTPETFLMRVQLIRNSSETLITSFLFSIDSMPYIAFQTSAYSQASLTMNYRVTNV